MARVLIGDDDAPFRQFVRIALRRAGHEVTEAGNGAQVLEEAARCRPEVVVLDLDLGGPSGVEVARMLHEAPGMAELPVLLLTADAPRERPPGIVAVLEKPVDPDALVDAVARVVQTPEGEL